MADRCGAKRRQGDGAPCTLTAGWGTSHPGIGRCRNHGGSAPSSVKAAELVRAESQARKHFGKLVEIRPIDNPLVVYREFAGGVAAWLVTCEDMVAELSSPGYSGKTGEQIRAEVQIFERAMDRMNTVLSTYARLNIDERLAGVTIEQKKMIIRAIEAALASAGIGGPAMTEAKKVAARHLRLVAGDADDAVAV